MEIMNIIFDIAGVLISIGFIWLMIHSSKSLVGSFFKKYYRLMVIAAVTFGLGFLIEATGEYMGFEIYMVDIIHHVFLIIAAVMFVYAGIVFPKEAEEVTRTRE